MEGTPQSDDPAAKIKPVCLHHPALYAPAADGFDCRLRHVDDGLDPHPGT